MVEQNVIMETQLDKGDFQTGQVITIASGHFIHDVYSAFLAPLLPLIIEKMSLSLTMAGGLECIYAASSHNDALYRSPGG